jgi:4-aminobutyrate aminotransferase-like enzyme
VAIGNAVLDVIEQERLPENAARLGARILDGVRAMAEEHAIIGDVRGLGLYLGVELVRDRETLQPAGEEASWVIDRMRQLGVLVSTDGPFHNVLKIKPPLVWTDADVDRLLAVLDRVLREPALRR